jgi:hypothetical protein
MRISAQRLYNTAKAGDHGLLAFMLECQEQQGYSENKLVASAMACPDLVARTHTLIVLKTHSIGGNELNAPMDVYDMRQALAHWRPMWKDEWDQMLEIRLAEKQSLFSNAWARAALISGKPHEYVMQLVRRGSDDVSSSEVAGTAAHIMAWPMYWGMRGGNDKQQHGTLEQVSEWLHFCHAQDVRAADYLWAYVKLRCDARIAALVFNLTDLRRMQDVDESEVFLLKYATTQPASLNAFVRGYS